MNLDLVLKPFDDRVAEVRRTLKLGSRRREVFDFVTSLVDREKVADLQTFVAGRSDHLGVQPVFKYLDIPLNLSKKSRLFMSLDLDRGGPRRMLDLGSGAGHFLFLAKCHGHQVVGLDMYNEIYDRMFDVYGLDRITRTVNVGEALDLPDRFDLITATQVTFNRPIGKAKLTRTSPFWTVAEWRWFFDEICGLMTYPGRIFLHLNPQPDPMTGEFERDYLLTLFMKNGALVDRHLSTALFDLRQPLSLRD